MLWTDCQFAESFVYQLALCAESSILVIVLLLNLLLFCQDEFEDSCEMFSYNVLIV